MNIAKNIVMSVILYKNIYSFKNRIISPYYYIIRLYQNNCIFALTSEIRVYLLCDLLCHQKWPIACEFLDRYPAKTPSQKGPSFHGLARIICPLSPSVGP